MLNVAGRFVVFIRESTVTSSGSVLSSDDPTWCAMQWIIPRWSPEPRPMALCEAVALSERV